MTDQIKTLETKGLFENPKVTDKAKVEFTKRREVKDARPIETGDIIFTSIKSDLIDEIVLDVYTFKPEDEPQEFFPGFHTFPSDTTVYINGLQLISKEASDDSVSTRLTKTYQLITENNFQPAKSIFLETQEIKSGAVEVLERHIFNPKTELSLFNLTKDDLIKLRNNAIKVRTMLKQNLLDQPDESTGLTDPRLHQLDNMINHISTNQLFSI